MRLVDLLHDLAQQFGVIFIVAGVFLMSGLAVFGWGVLSTIEALSSRSWPSVSGDVVTSQVSSYIDEDEDGSTLMYTAYIRYTYQVENRQYYGELVSLENSSTTNQKTIEKIVARYPQGSMVNVYYNPADPDQAVLEPGLSAGLLIPLGIGISCTATAGLLVYWMLRTHRAS